MLWDRGVLIWSRLQEFPSSLGSGVGIMSSLRNSPLMLRIVCAISMCFKKVTLMWLKLPPHYNLPRHYYPSGHGHGNATSWVICIGFQHITDPYAYELKSVDDHETPMQRRRSISTTQPLMKFLGCDAIVIGHKEADSSKMDLSLPRRQSELMWSREAFKIQSPEIPQSQFKAILPFASFTYLPCARKFCPSKSGSWLRILLNTAPQPQPLLRFDRYFVTHNHSTSNMGPWRHYLNNLSSLILPIHLNTTSYNPYDPSFSFLLHFHSPNHPKNLRPCALRTTLSSGAPLSINDTPDILDFDIRHLATTDTLV